jgi:protocatechuate 3,4-dioxygenase beta subunit
VPVACHRVLLFSKNQSKTVRAVYFILFDVPRDRGTRRINRDYRMTLKSEVNDRSCRPFDTLVLHIDVTDVYGDQLASIGLI